MSYATGEALILTLVQALADYDTDNTSRKKWGLLSQGHSNKYVILRRGASAAAFHGMGGARQTTYNTVAELWLRYVDDGTSANDLDAEIKTVRDKIDKTPQLGDTADVVIDAVVRSIGEPQEMWVEGGNGPSWLKAELTIEWIEQETLTLA